MDSNATPFLAIDIGKENIAIATPEIDTQVSKAFF